MVGRRARRPAYAEFTSRILGRVSSLCAFYARARRSRAARRIRPSISFSFCGILFSSAAVAMGSERGGAPRLLPGRQEKARDRLHKIPRQPCKRVVLSNLGGMRRSLGAKYGPTKWDNNVSEWGEMDVWILGWRDRTLYPLASPSGAANPGRRCWPPPRSFLGILFGEFDGFGRGAGAVGLRRPSSASTGSSPPTGLATGRL